MNINSGEPVHKEFSLKLVNAIQNPDTWSDVLDWIIQHTGAKAAIITLRHKDSCQIVDDVELEQKFHSPLIRGFSHEAIVYYLTNLRTTDPWAEIQKTYYPYRPVQMSKIYPPENIVDKSFLNWLSREGFEDTIVFELDRMAGYWTAINLFLEDTTGVQAEKLMSFSNSNFELLRNSWQASQELARQRQANIALLAQASSGGAPVCLAGANGELIECNNLFTELIKTDAIRISGAARKLSFAHTLSIHGLDRWEQHDFIVHTANVKSMLLLASPVEPDPLFAEKREQFWILTCSNTGQAKIEQSITASYNLAVLTRQEHLLYAAVVDGKSVSDAGKSINLKRSRAFEVWSSVKNKLGIISAHNLR